MSDHSTPIHTHCQNCGEALQGPFCHRCGQHDIDFHRSFGHVFLEALETWFHFDGKLFRDFGLLLAKPGRLTRDFLQGKRASQVPPFRLYLFVSVVFFAWLHYSATPLVDVAAPEVSELDHPASSATPPETTATEVAPAENAAADSAAKPRAKFNLKTDLPPDVEERIEKNLANPEDLRERVLHLLPRMLLVCLPLFALLSQALSRRAGWAYLQHLVIALHLHTFVFVAWLVEDLLMLGAGYLSESLASIIDISGALYVTLYFFVFMKELYGGGWKRALSRGLLLGGLYGVILAIGMAVIGWFEVSS